MKILSLSLVVLLSSCALGQAPKKEQEEATKKEYVSEAPLPEAWPTPGPYDKVVEKEFPAYRAAYTPSSLDGFAFMTLFSHIKRNDIPMTAPVEKTMSMDPEMKMSAMGFLYQNGEVGAIGKDGKKVEVKDMAKTKVLTYAWFGDDDDDNVAKAKKAIEEALKAQGKEAVQYRMMGYNGPQTPRKSKTWELHAVLK
jgi:SOUL heme-binding protein